MIKDVILKVKENGGKFKPKCSKKDFVYNLILDLCLLATTAILIFEILNVTNKGILVISAILVVVLEYMVLISPYQQYPEKYRIEFENEENVYGFKIFYRKKEVKIPYKKAEDGKILLKFDNNLKNIYYVDGSKMAKLTKLRVKNYLESWLKDNELISNS